MIFLFNKERVLNEVMEWFQLRACDALKIRPDQFGLSLTVDENGRLTPDVQLSQEDIDGVTEEQLRELLSGLFQLAVSMYNERIQGLTSCRSST
jgi:hypothetical protein